jgi:protein AbiQ
MSQLQFYHVDTAYIDYLDKFQKHIWENEEKGRKRPYVGLIMEISGFKYFAPMTSPKPKHFSMPEDLDLKKIFYKGELTGVINLNNLIPVKDEHIQMIDMVHLKNVDPKYSDLLNNQILIVRKRHDEFIKDANLIYKIKTRNYKGYVGLKKRCYDFKKLESKCSEYNC